MSFTSTSIGGPAGRGHIAGSPTKGIVLIVGGAYSGKSAFVHRLLSDQSTAAVVGTGEPEDEVAKRRITQLQSERPTRWKTFDRSVGLVEFLTEAIPGYQQVAVDSINQWIAAEMVHGQAKYSEEHLEAHIEHCIGGLCRWLASRPAECVALVSAEVGCSPAPARPLERSFRRLLGGANCRLAQIADTVITMNCGIPLVIKGKVTNTATTPSWQRSEELS